MANKKKAVIAGASEAIIESIKLVPGIAILIEGVRKYYEHVNEQQSEEFVQLLSERIEKIEQHLEWYKSEAGVRFVRKTVATALNAEYVDKLEYLANAFANGPSLGDEAHHQKFLEMIRLLSKPSLDVLVASLNNPFDKGTREILVPELATFMKWSPHLVDACVSELFAAGAYSSVTSWNVSGHRTVSKSQYYQNGTAAKTSLTEQFVLFITKQ